MAPVVLTVAVVAGLGTWRIATTDPADTADRADAPTSRQVGGSAAAQLRSTVRIGTDGSLRTTERLTFSAPQSSLTVSIAARPASAGFSPRVDDLRVRVVGLDDQGPTGAIVEGDAFTFELPDQATSAVLDYVVTGAVVRSRPAPPGRVVALVTPLTFAPFPEHTSRIEIDGEGVLNAGCTVADGDASACGARSPDGWVVDLAADDLPVDVIAQVDMPTS